jgi:hypothetical protein
MSDERNPESTRDTGRDGSSGEPSRQEEGAPARAERTRTQPPGEKGGPKGPEPTRFGDWEKNGRCFDF